MLLRAEAFRRKRWYKRQRLLRTLARRRRRISDEIDEVDEMLAFLRKSMCSVNVPRIVIKDLEYVVKIPEVFSLLDNPEETLAAIAQLVAVPATPFVKTIVFDHSRCRDIDLGANAFFDVCALLLRKKTELQRKKYNFAGILPDHERTMNLIKVMGITKHLHVQNTSAPQDFEKQVVHFPLQHGRKRSDDAYGTSDQELVSTRLADHLNECFLQGSNQKYRLGDVYKGQIGNWAGEIITNAEEHSGIPDWYAMSYMIPLETGVEAGVNECHLVIFSFGQTIYENLSSKIAPGPVRDQILQLIEKHTASGFFSRPKYTPPNLWTLYALQDGVSRFSDTKEGVDRGRGTVSLIEAFQKLGQTVDGVHRPKMILMSGSTRIVFDGRFQMRREKVDNGYRSIIAFNAENSLEQCHDEQCVETLRGVFPGTLIALRFYVDTRHLDRIVAERHANPPPMK